MNSSGVEKQGAPPIFQRGAPTLRSSGVGSFLGGRVQPEGPDRLLAGGRLPGLNLLLDLGLSLGGFLLLVGQLSVDVSIGRGWWNFAGGSLGVWSLRQTAFAGVLRKRLKPGIKLLPEAVVHLLQVVDGDRGFKPRPGNRFACCSLRLRAPCCQCRACHRCGSMTSPGVSSHS